MILIFDILSMYFNSPEWKEVERLDIELWWAVYVDHLYLEEGLNIMQNCIMNGFKCFKTVSFLVPPFRTVFVRFVTKIKFQWAGMIENIYPYLVVLRWVEHDLAVRIIFLVERQKYFIILFCFITVYIWVGYPSYCVNLKKLCETLTQ